MRFFLGWILVILSVELFAGDMASEVRLTPAALTVVTANIIAEVDRCLDAAGSDQENVSSFRAAMAGQDITRALALATQLAHAKSSAWVPHALLAECHIVSGDFERAAFQIAEASQLCTDAACMSRLKALRTTCQRLRQLGLLLWSIDADQNIIAPSIDHYAAAYTLGMEGPNGLQFDDQRLVRVGTLDDSYVAADFHFRNTSAVPVTITTIKPSCGCTTAEIDKTTYLPGETGSLHVVFTTEDRYGHQENRIVVSTNLSTASTTLALIVELPVAGLVLDTPLVSWKMRSVPEERIVHLIAAGDVPYSLSGILYDKQLFHVRYEKDPTGYVVRVVPVSTNEPATAILEVQTNHARKLKIFCRIGNE